MTAQECEYLTYQLPATDIKLDELPEELEQQVICLLYKNERYDSSNPQIEICSREDLYWTHVIDTFILKREISPEESEEKKYKYCLASFCFCNGIKAYFVVYKLENPPGIGVQTRVVGFNAYNLDWKALSCDLVNSSDGKYLCCVKGDSIIFGYNDNTRNYILPPKSILLQGIHVDVIDSDMSGILEIEKDLNSEYLIRELYFKDIN